MKNPVYLNCLDIILSNISGAQSEKINSKINLSKLKVMPLTSWDIFTTGQFIRSSQINKIRERNAVLSFANKFKWKTDLSEVFDESDYEALILTDKSQKILWVNDGFSDMTGYTKTFALNKTPRFLQGKDTSVTTKKQIAQKITEGKPFKEIIINHKKDGTPYKCEVKIIPLLREQEITHYIAFERQVG